MLIFCCCDITPGQAKPNFRMPFLLKRYLRHHYPTVSANLLTRVVCKITAIFRAGEKEKKKTNRTMVCYVCLTESVEGVKSKNNTPVFLVSRLSEGTLNSGADLQLHSRLPRARKQTPSEVYIPEHRIIYLLNSSEDDREEP